MDPITIFLNNVEWEEQWKLDVDASGENNSPIELHQALTRDTAQYLIEEQGYPINRQTHVTLSTALVQALKKGRNEVAKFLLESGCDPNLPTKDGDSALHIAVSTNNEELVIILLNSKANPYAVNTYGQSILHISVNSNHTNNLLPILLECTQENDHINKQDIKGRSALRCASRNKLVHQEMIDYDPLYNVQLLLSNGADPNLVCWQGLSPLHVATCGQFPTTVLALIHSSANLHAKTNDVGQTALHIASQEDSLEIVRILIDAGSDMNTTDNHLYTLLHCVRTNEILQYLLRTPTIGLIDAKSDEGHTPLHVIVNRYNGIDMIQTLVNANADIYAINNKGQSCLHTTCMDSINTYRLITVQKLVDIGVNVLLEDNYHYTALHYIPESDTECRKYLQEVMNNCTTNPGFKRANMNTDSDNDKEEEDNMCVDEYKTK